MRREDRTHIRKAASRQAHRGRAHKDASHNEEVGMGFRHRCADGLDEREDDEGGHGVGDEGGDDEDEGGEDDEDAVKVHALDAFGDGAGDGVQEAGGGDGLAKGETTGCEDDDGPEEIVEVFLGEDAGAEEQGHGDDGDNAHVAKDAFQLVRDAPEHDGAECDDADEPLHASEAIFHGPDGDDGRAFARLEGDEEEDPDQEDGDDADGEGNKEPCAPAGFGIHVL